ncbi:MAG: Holliday junction resolvase RuvX [Patescibacteria group bacterium]|nr:Holliday junction resolvase RuvX [Patescibacteria group bacterium]
MAKILALDVGKKRIGLAMSDDLKIIASPYKTIERKAALKELENIIEKEDVESLVLGLPYLESGDLGSQAKDIGEFAKELSKKIDIKIEFVNELLTSKEAEHRYHNMNKKAYEKGKIDEMAATIILEDYLTGRKSE